MLAAALLVVLTGASTATVPPELTGVLDQHLTASAPSAVAVCTAATKGDRPLLPDGEAQERRVWSCSMMCSAPIGHRSALLGERRWRQPVLFLDGNNDYRRIVLRVGDQLPDFKYRDIASGAWSALSDTRNGLVLLVVWSSWCPPAIEELPRIEYAFRTLGPKGLTVIGLPDDWERRTAESVISRFRLTWPNADPESIREMLTDHWQVASVPLLIVLDADRRILRVSRSGDTSLRGTNLQKTLDRMLRASREAS
jgi:peroxiredoxin